MASRSSSLRVCLLMRGCGEGICGELGSIGTSGSAGERPREVGVGAEKDLATRRREPDVGPGFLRETTPVSCMMSAHIRRVRRGGKRVVGEGGCLRGDRLRGRRDKEGGLSSFGLLRSEYGDGGQTSDGEDAGGIQDWRGAWESGSGRMGTWGRSAEGGSGTTVSWSSASDLRLSDTCSEGKLDMGRRKGTVGRGRSYIVLAACQDRARYSSSLRSPVATSPCDDQPCPANIIIPPHSRLAFKWNCVPGSSSRPVDTSPIIHLHRWSKRASDSCHLASSSPSTHRSASPPPCFPPHPHRSSASSSSACDRRIRR